MVKFIETSVFSVLAFIGLVLQVIAIPTPMQASIGALTQRGGEEGWNLESLMMRDHISDLDNLILERGEDEVKRGNREGLITRDIEEKREDRYAGSQRDLEKRSRWSPSQRDLEKRNRWGASQRDPEKKSGVEENQKGLEKRYRFSSGQRDLEKSGVDESQKGIEKRYRNSVSQKDLEKKSKFDESE